MAKKEVKSPIIEEKIKKSLNYSIKDGIVSSVASGTGDNFISAFAVSLKATNFELGLLSALPNLIPGELFTARAMEKWSRKKIMLFGVLMQSLLWLPIALLPLIFLKKAALAPILLIIFYTVYIGFGWFISPAWSSWMKNLTEGREKGKYFGLRNKIGGIAGLSATIIAGLALDGFKHAGLVFVGFTSLFVVASLSRLTARHYINKKYEPKLKLKKGYYFSFWQFVKKAPTNNYGKFAIFIALINFAVAISSPFFAPYLLKELKFNYITYTLINLVVQAAFTLLFMPIWGKFADKYGSIKTMRLTAYFIPLVPLLWLVSSSPYWLILSQMFAGIVWAGFNLAAANFTLEAVTKERVSLCSAYLSFLGGICVFVGSLLGGLIASLNITFMNIFLFVFLISGIARMIIVALMIKNIKEVRPVEKLRTNRWKMSTIPLADLNPIKNLLGGIERHSNHDSKKGKR